MIGPVVVPTTTDVAAPVPELGFFCELDESGLPLDEGDLGGPPRPNRPWSLYRLDLIVLNPWVSPSRMFNI